MNELSCVIRAKSQGARVVHDTRNSGFQLDFNNNTEDWMKLTPYNKLKMIRGMYRTIEKSESEEKHINGLFFLEVPHHADGVLKHVTDNVKDQVSKDLYIPWHQIKPVEFEEW
ncbi:hypothetical protein HBH56_128960 [Parastagonospora nodorum]|uniref:Uncharacterized protein n=2 Tax=Phaeosphaeria nodorum (strain SN15 / ATCC MYA-4574 / FGSC 10173) TaxID=321614 RepID=A0A7U2NPD2_PHANO|nr:hypothetical protein SNOG_05907 [Parastagonospora nodorum SN15]KAH3911818.1 hypothetical protein HBH56_128960 [Parastagonospora nodorum]EAT86971.2 hypothetical protein SNOG_05907 [Parastagonospora nodorum SN15]KAH3931562.1 hypothetical protein HBH54_094540 [Parastagonospora nodorum]KAH4135048.1 hypothetical protein HBH45_154510 [Parastagonospora nodorum]KAH4159447.1 hypothetical protein HBH44_104350 [Parastagonospora nodorum]